MGGVFSCWLTMKKTLRVMMKIILCNPCNMPQYVQRLACIMHSLRVVHYAFKPWDIFWPIAQKTQYHSMNSHILWYKPRICSETGCTVFKIHYIYTTLVTLYFDYTSYMILLIVFEYVFCMVDFGCLVKCSIKHVILYTFIILELLCDINFVCLFGI